MTEAGCRPPKFKVGDRVVFCHLDRMPYPENTMASLVFVVLSYSADQLGDDPVYFYSLDTEKADSRISATPLCNLLISEENLMEAQPLAWDQESI
jgi:hypothetical protein